MPVLFPDLQHMNEAYSESADLEANEEKNTEHGESSDLQHDASGSVDLLGTTYTEAPSNDEILSTYSKTLPAITNVTPIIHRPDEDSLSTSTTSASTTDQSVTSSVSSTLTAINITPSSETQTTSYTTSQSQSDLPTSTTTAVSSGGPLPTAELVGIVVGAISLAAILIFVVGFGVILHRRKRAARASDNRKSAPVQVNALRSHFSVDSSQPNPTPSNWTDSRELKTEFIPKPPKVANPSRTYEVNRYWDIDSEGYNRGLKVDEGEGEPSGSRDIEEYNSGIKHELKWKGKEREEF
ncbi:hypothetical protein F53441_8957 [Fusarium austroafricanum]|uniref:Mid2 domain-containing protein n=1 Tax=Fusarium austroafricanum TaxID=2364996 RepID=A0A8H4KDB4_9HYPO|nr:hypothetical protein F53441_8957 [Fusarium austroafricanum]